MLAGLVAGTSYGQVGATFYQNTSNDEHQGLSLGTAMVGDEIILAGNSATYTVTNFAFEYYGIGLGSSAKMDVRFYKNDGPPSGAHANSPGTLIWDSGLFSVSDATRATLTFNGAGDSHFVSGVVVPKDFTWTVQFSSLAGGADGGVDLYGPPTVGQGYTDYWYNDPVNGWQLRTISGVDVSFGATLQAVPEPSSLSLLAGFGVLGLLLRRGNKR